MPAEAGIQDQKYMNKIKNWIPAFAGMTPFSLITTQPLVGEGRVRGRKSCLFVVKWKRDYRLIFSERLNLL